MLLLSYALYILFISISVNTTGFLCPYFADLSLASTPSNITLNSTHYVVVTQLSQPITSFSSLNISGYVYYYGSYMSFLGW